MFYDEKIMNEFDLQINQAIQAENQLNCTLLRFY